MPFNVCRSLGRAPTLVERTYFPVGARPSERIRKSADADSEFDVVPGLHCTAGNRRPLEEAHREAVLTATDFGIQLAVVGQTYP